MAKSLADLKRENAESESLNNPTPEVEDELVENEEVEAEEVDEPDSDDESEDTDSESWMKEGEEPEDDRKVPLSKHISVRSALKEKVRERDSELEALKAEIKSLKQSKPVTQQSDEPKPPKAEDYLNEYDEIDYAKFNEANQKYTQDLIDYRLTGSAKKSQDEQNQAKLKAERETTVNHLYERAEKLVNDGVLTAEDYHNADSAIVSTIDALLPGNGRDIADGLIQHLSEVSDQPEKVWFKLGKDKALLNQVIEAYQHDQTGVKGIAMLAKISQKYVSPSKKTTSAPKPAKKVQGDVTVNSDAAKLQKKYNEAHKKRNTSEAFNIKRQAKKSGVDVSNW